MNDKKDNALPKIGSSIYSACGGPMTFNNDTSRALYQDRWVFFCLPSCKDDFNKDPATSCLDAQELSGDQG